MSLNGVSRLPSISSELRSPLHVTSEFQTGPSSEGRAEWRNLDLGLRQSMLAACALLGRAQLSRNHRGFIRGLSGRAKADWRLCKVWWSAQNSCGVAVSFVLQSTI